MAEKLSCEKLEKRIRELADQKSALEDTIRSLWEKEEKFRMVYENAPVMIDAFQYEGGGVLWNKECEKMLGWTEEEILSSGDPLALIFPDQGLRSRVLEDQLRADGIFREYTATARDSSKRIQVWANFRLPTGAIISVGHDITEIKQAEEGLKKSEQDFRELVENSPTGISIIQDEKIVYRNPEQQRLFGPVPDTHYPSMYSRIHPDDADKLSQMYSSAMSGQPQSSGVDIRFFPSGDASDEADMKCLHCRANLIEYNGKMAVLINQMDVTKAREMDRMLNIQDRMTSLGHVAAGIAHEIRNPLSGINIYLDTLGRLSSQGENAEKIREVLGKIQSASSKIESVIRRVMDFSKPSEPRLVLIDIHTPIQEALGLSSVTLHKTGIELETVLQEGLPACYADPQLIEQVMLNLIMNAAEAMKEMDDGKKIRITTALSGEFLAIRVSDSGPGIPWSQKQKIFDPFYTTKNGSTGIGLSLSHRIIQDHGGSLKVSSCNLGGAEFTILLPIQNRGL